MNKKKLKTSLRSILSSSITPSSFIFQRMSERKFQLRMKKMRRKTARKKKRRMTKLKLRMKKNKRHQRRKQRKMRRRPRLSTKQFGTGNLSMKSRLSG